MGSSPSLRKLTIITQARESNTQNNNKQKYSPCKDSKQISNIDLNWSIEGFKNHINVTLFALINNFSSTSSKITNTIHFLLERCNQS